MTEFELKEHESDKIGELLSMAIANKEHMHPADMRRSALLFYNVIKNGFIFYEDDLDKAIEMSGESYSQQINEYLHQMVNVLNDLNQGQRNENGEYYSLKRE